MGDTLKNKIVEIERMLSSAGYRLTMPRKLVVRTFVETQRHLRPEDLYQLLRRQGVSRPSVYRNIDTLKKIGIIKEITINHERYYELSMFSGKKLHLHFQCRVCGKIKEYTDEHLVLDLIKQREYIEKTHEDDIEDTTIIMKGICKTCKEETRCRDQ